MTVEKTLSIIKPDAVRRNLTGKIMAMFEEEGLSIVAQKKLRLTKNQAGLFYFIHKERPFYRDLCEFMSSGPISVQVLEGANAIELNRKIMGATNPKDAESGTIRKEFALSLTENTVHGSDSKDTAKEEIAFFFSKMEILDF
ncbi:nucleoside-diphosphate kinase [Paracoccaceae bacterium]|nr:nucleoside-diphosphate kinase [Paracoccaceae bacterium]